MWVRGRFEFLFFIFISKSRVWCVPLSYFDSMSIENWLRVVFHTSRQPLSSRITNFPISSIKSKDGLERRGLNVWRPMSVTVTWLTLTRKTETHEEPAFDINWCCKPHRMGLRLKYKKNGMDVWTDCTVYDKCTMCANDSVHHNLKMVFVCLHIALFLYHSPSYYHPLPILIINNCLELCHERMVCAVWLVIFLRCFIPFDTSMK